jgi:DNA polymerase I-like protein with 3'-5' exonuclease and polymerase domains
MDAQGVERPFTWDMLNNGMRAWKARFHGVGRFLDLTPDEVRSFGGTAINVYGRERHFGSVLMSYNDQIRKAAERECVNFLIQSVAGAATIRTLILIDQMLDKYIDSGELHENDVFLINTVHDSLAYEVKDHLVPWFKDAMTAIATREIPELNGHRFEMDVGVGANWTQAEMAA